MKLKSLLFSAVVSLLWISSSLSQVSLNKTAQSTMNFLLVSTSSRAGALGDAYTSIGSGSESMFYNPAGLSSLSRTFDINLNYTSWIADINYMSGGAAWNFGMLGVIGVNLLIVDYGDIHGTSLISPDQINEYPLGYQDNGLVNNVSAYSLGLSYARSISEQFSIGGTVKLVGQNLGENIYPAGVTQNNASKLAFDAGIRYLTDFNGFMFGMSIRNFSTNIKREEIDEQLPLVFTLGGAINIMDFVDKEFSKDNSLYAAVDFLHHNNYSERVNLGLEYMFLNMFFIRGGYQTNRDLASWSGGLGFNTSFSEKLIQVNYSYSKFELFDNVSRISLIFTF